jgi:hypothetical protein
MERDGRPEETCLSDVRAYAETAPPGEDTRPSSSLRSAQSTRKDHRSMVARPAQELLHRIGAVDPAVVTTYDFGEPAPPAGVSGDAGHAHEDLVHAHADTG